MNKPPLLALFAFVAACGTEPLDPDSSECGLEPSASDDALAFTQQVGGLRGSSPAFTVFSDGRVEILQPNGTLDVSTGTATGAAALQAELAATGLLDASAGCYGLDATPSPDALYLRVSVRADGTWLRFGGDPREPAGLLSAHSRIEDYARAPR